MKLSLAAISLIALAASSNAQYFSAGWRPGQAAQETTTTAEYVPQPSSTPPEPAQPQKPFSISSLFDFNRILTSAPAAALFSKVGINITEKVQAALDLKIWDERVELITDDNYKELIVNETMTEQEAKDRVWLIVVCVYCYIRTYEGRVLTFTSQFRYLCQAGWCLQVPRRGLRQSLRRLTNRRRPTSRQMGTCRLHECDLHHHEMGDLAVRSLFKSQTQNLTA